MLIIENTVVVLLVGDITGIAVVGILEGGGIIGDSIVLEGCSIHCLFGLFDGYMKDTEDRVVALLAFSFRVMLCCWSLRTEALLLGIQELEVQVG